MTKFKYLSCYSGAYTLDNGKSGVAFYIIAVKYEKTCKPQVIKATQDVYKEAAKLKGEETVNLFFDENQRATSMYVIQ